MTLRWRQLLRISFLVICALLFFRFWNKDTPPIPAPMSPSPSASEVASALLAEKGLRLQSLKVIQSLWAGYGQICRITATPDTTPGNSLGSSRTVSAENSNVNTPLEVQSYILKLITPPPTKPNDEGHARKILSYQVEQYFYSALAPQLPALIPVAKCLASINQQHPDGTSTTAMIMNDLKQEFPLAGEKRNVLSLTQVHAALDWLSGFHSFWWGRVKDLDRDSLVLPPLDEIKREHHGAEERSVWLNGGYTYLATRRKEYASLVADESEWTHPLTSAVHGGQSIADLAAAFLSLTTKGESAIEAYQTLIHGDVKSENLFTSESGKHVAFYDFQYTGLGLGVCDLAKLFTCSVPLSMLVSDRKLPDKFEMQAGEKALLERYWKRLRDVGKQEYDWDVFVRHWDVALVDWLRFQASWGFWGNTEWLEARVRSILSDSDWRTWLINSVKNMS